MSEVGPKFNIYDISGVESTSGDCIADKFVIIYLVLT
jgi:hypothetical protein